MTIGSDFYFFFLITPRNSFGKNSLLSLSMNETIQKVVLVDENDQVLGEMEKLEAHEKGLLHRAISVFIFNRHGQMLLQQRASQKYHSPNLWTNACCSHPYLGERYQEAAERRLQEELNLSTPLKPLFQFIYKADVGEGLYEHELDHVFVGNYEGEISPNPKEVKALKWITVNELTQDMQENREEYTVWFQIIFDKFLNFFLDESLLV